MSTRSTLSSEWSLSDTAVSVGVGRPRARRPWLRRLVTAVLVAAIGSVIGVAVFRELKTSALQSRLLSEYAARLSYEVVPGASGVLLPARTGPFDDIRGYSRMPAFQQRLESEGYDVTLQARPSPELVRVLNWGLTPPYREPALAGLVVRGSNGGLLHNATSQARLFADFDAIPPLLVNTLLWVENRELLAPGDPRSNPAIEWDRLAKASVLYAGSKLGLTLAVQGGSTLATQLEKYRHSPRGRTNSAAEKFRQLASASLRAYRQGSDTSAWRRQIVLDYLNSVPLSAPPGYGEVHGFGEALYTWFGLDLDGVITALTTPEVTSDKLRAYKHILALVVSLRAPTTYLLRSRAALEEHVNEYTYLLVEQGVIDDAFARGVRATALMFLPHAPLPHPRPFVDRKATNAVRTSLLRLLGVPGFYDLDRLHLEVDTTIDTTLQEKVGALLANMTNKDFVAANGLNGERLLRASDPSKVIYSLMLFERTPQGNALRVHADNLDTPFDINDGVKLELGSTAKLRTMAHYLEIVAALHAELSGIDAATLTVRAHDAGDPITKWAAETLAQQPGLDLEAFLQRSLERKYSASPYETFFTGGGVHTFGNFDNDDNGRVLTLRESLRRSVNLPFIRLMRDLVRYHQARLPYDQDAVLDDPKNPDRQRLLAKIADDEARAILARRYRAYHNRPADEIVERFLGSKAHSPRQLAIVFFAWHPGATADGLAVWLRPRVGKISSDEVQRLTKAFGGRLTLSDYGYLLGRHPLEVWLAGDLYHAPAASWADIISRSTEARTTVSDWLLRTRNRRPQNIRLRIQIEKDAFERMTPAWKRLGFPFEHLVATYATAIGNSSDRPAALAELMGIIVNDGLRRPMLRLTRLHFAEGTPYESVFEPSNSQGEQVMVPAVARILRANLAEVVENGTARRVAGAFRKDDGTAEVVGGKTGSGDNRFETFNRSGGVTSSRAVNRTATFVFYVGQRYFGVLTAYVPGQDAANYSFTSALPVSVLKLLAPALNPPLTAAQRSRPATAG